MPAPFDSFKPFSFANTPFPFKTYSVKGGLRKHTFEFPHQQGGLNEKLGRKLYEIHVTAEFTQGLEDPKYQDLFETLTILRGLFEDKTTATLNIPHIGPLKACADQWTENVNQKNTSTISVDFSFFEDQDAAFFVMNPISIGPGAMADNIDALNTQLILHPIESQQNLFGQINDIASSILAFKDQFDLYGSLIVSKIDGLTSLLREADQQVKELNHPDFWPVLDSLHDLWLSTVQLDKDLHDKGSLLRTFTTPMRMGIAQVSATLFGDNSKAVDLMQLNALDDPLSIAPGTPLRYYDLTA